MTFKSKKALKSLIELDKLYDHITILESNTFIRKNCLNELRVLINKYDVEPTVIFLAMNIIDTYLSQIIGIEKSGLALAAFILAANYENDDYDIYILTTDILQYIVLPDIIVTCTNESKDNQTTVVKKYILGKQIELLMVLDWNLEKQSKSHIYSYVCMLNNGRPLTKHMKKYCIHTLSCNYCINRSRLILAIVIYCLVKNISRPSNVNSSIFEKAINHLQTITVY